MRRMLAIGGASLLLLATGGTATAAGPDGPGPWTDAYEPGLTNIGVRTDGSDVPAPRDDPQNAVGVAETPGGLDPESTPATAFYSLGMGGTLVLRFDQPACNQNGADLVLDIREVTLAPPDPKYPEETAKVSVSQNGTTWVQVASKINRDSSVSVPAGLRFVRYVRIVDTTAATGYSKRPTPGDGIDIDGVKALNIDGCGTFSCRASAIRVTNGPPVPIMIEPSVANGPGSPCQTDTDSLIGLVGFTPADIDASAGTADTTLSGSNPRASAMSNLASVDIGIISASADSMDAHAEATCVSGSQFPALTGESTVVNLQAAGQTIDGSDPWTIDIPNVGKILLNQKFTETVGGETRIVVRAFEFVPAPPLIMGLPTPPRIVMGEAIADYEGAPCPG